MTPKIGVVTGSRGEWGYLRPVLSQMVEKEMQFELFVTNMHLQPENGESWKEIVSDGFQITEKIPLDLKGPELVSWPRSLGQLASALPEMFVKHKIDLLLVAGDRAETLASVMAAYYADIPIAHIQAGERSGSKDGMARHAIGRLASLHFSSNNDASDRLLKSGEEPHRIFQVGAPQLDDMVQKEPYFTIKTIANKWLQRFLASKRRFALCVYHPTTEELQEQKGIVADISEHISSMGINQIWLYPNNDLGSREIAEQIDCLKTSFVFRARNLKRSDYLSLLKGAVFIIGNSSSGIIEAPTFCTPAINIGSRQNDRIQAESVVNVKADLSDLQAGLDCAIKYNTPGCVNFDNPYGDGHSASRIVEVLANLRLQDPKFKNKRMTF